MRMLRTLSMLLIAVGMAVHVTVVHAEQRLALVIGINAYPNLATEERPEQNQLDKAIPDAESMKLTA
jgi:hypothetical protein